MITPEKIKKLRFENNDMSQQELADKLGVSKQYISDLERGKKPISLNFEKKLIEKGLVSTEEKLCIASDKLKISTAQLQEIIDFIYNEPDLILYAIQAIKGDKTALEKFNKLVG